MGWEDRHLYLFEANGQRYGVPDAEWDWEPPIRPARTTRFSQIARAAGATLSYEYDFGDDWQHEIVIEALLPRGPHDWLPYCLDGARACPPEDCGGVTGYAGPLAALADLTDPEHDEWQQWVGAGYDPEHFDARAVNGELRRMR